MLFPVKTLWYMETKKLTWLIFSVFSHELTDVSEVCHHHFSEVREVRTELNHRTTKVAAVQPRQEKSRSNSVVTSCVYLLLIFMFNELSSDDLAF